MASADMIIEQALELDEKDRARVAHELLRSLDGADESGSVDAWTEELRRRVKEIEDGSVEVLSLDEVKRRMAERRAKRRAQNQ